MMIVIGRGNRRNTLELPCAAIVNRSPRSEQAQALTLICNMLGIETDTTSMESFSEQETDRSKEGHIF